VINVAVVLVDRANWGRLAPVVNLLLEDDVFHVNMVYCGSTVLTRFHDLATSISSCYRYASTFRIYHEVEGSNCEALVASMSCLMPQLVQVFNQINPDFVILIGDRYEALAVATVASMLKLCIVHFQGGEHSGNIDESIRHAITKLSHYHVPATNQAAMFLQSMGERADKILTVGCPSVDIAENVTVNDDWKESVLCVYHPEFGHDWLIVKWLLKSLNQLHRHVIMFWPNIDPGSEMIMKYLRSYINTVKPDWLEMVVNVNPSEYLNMLASVKCCVGNSSSFVRDASFFGTPVVLIGNRQKGRIKTSNVKWYQGTDFTTLHCVINDWMKKHFSPSYHYGKVGVSKNFVKALKQVQPYYQK